MALIDAQSSLEFRFGRCKLTLRRQSRTQVVVTRCFDQVVLLLERKLGALREGPAALAADVHRQDRRCRRGAVASTAVVQSETAPHQATALAMQTRHLPHHRRDGDTNRLVPSPRHSDPSRAPPPAVAERRRCRLSNAPAGRRQCWQRQRFGLERQQELGSRARWRIPRQWQSHTAAPALGLSAKSLAKSSHSKARVSKSPQCRTGPHGHNQPTGAQQIFVPCRSYPHRTSSRQRCACTFLAFPFGSAKQARPSLCPGRMPPCWQSSRSTVRSLARCCAICSGLRAVLSRRPKACVNAPAG